MKLKEFNPNNTVSARTNGVASVGVNFTTGLFNFSKGAVELLGLKNEDKIVLLQDEEDKKQWFIEKVKDRGWVVRCKSNVTAGVLFNNVPMAKAIAESIDFKGTSGRVLIAGQPTVFEKRKLFGLLTSSLVNL